MGRSIRKRLKIPGSTPDLRGEVAYPEVVSWVQWSAIFMYAAKTLPFALKHVHVMRLLMSAGALVEVERTKSKEECIEAGEELEEMVGVG